MNGKRLWSFEVSSFLSFSMENLLCYDSGAGPHVQGYVVCGATDHMRGMWKCVQWQNLLLRNPISKKKSRAHISSVHWTKCSGCWPGSMQLYLHPCCPSLLCLYQGQFATHQSTCVRAVMGHKATAHICTFAICASVNACPCMWGPTSEEQSGGTTLYSVLPLWDTDLKVFWLGERCQKSEGKCPVTRNIQQNKKGLVAGSVDTTKGKMGGVNKWGVPHEL